MTAERAPAVGLVTATAVAHYRGRTAGAVYIVVVTPEGTTCSCPAASFHNVCWHVEDLEGRLAAAAELPMKTDPFAPFDKEPAVESEGVEPLPFPDSRPFPELARPRPRS